MTAFCTISARSYCPTFVALLGENIHREYRQTLVVQLAQIRLATLTLTSIYIKSLIIVNRIGLWKETAID
ncbi:hypothetical protein DSUL_140095 [Desulfovibrionales bacterium]